MSNCPRCHQSIDPQAVNCPHCGNILKAFGHPGIPLHQATKDSFLCDNCTYHEDDSCTFPQRPYAKTCTLYQDKSQSFIEEDILINSRNSNKVKAIKAWSRRNKGLIMLFILVVVSVLLALN